MKTCLLIIFAVSSLLLTANVNAAIFTTDSSGNDKNTFYSNETVYVYGNESVSAGSKSVRVYIVANSDSWTNGTVLTAVMPYSTVTTNATGHMPIALIWNPDATAGNYDLAVDANNDGVYNKSIDFIDNETSLGFQILEAPKPMLLFSLGEKTPANHDWNYSNSSQNAMIQIKATAGKGHDIVLSSLDLIAGGSGDDQQDISLIRVYNDSNSNGNVDDIDTLLAFGKFLTDNGVYVASLQDYTINANGVVYMIVTYTIGNSATDGETFNFQIISASASNPSGIKAIISGLPLASSNKTIVGLEAPAEIKTQIPTCSDYTNQSSCINGCRWCESDNRCRNADEICSIVCRGIIFLSIQQDNDASAVSISGLADCDDKTVYIREDSCDNGTIASCNVIGLGCSATFPSPSEGEHQYYACIDINNDNVFENSEQSQVVLVQAQQQTEVIQEKPQEGFNYLYLIIPAILILSGIVVYFLIFRKRKDEYEKLKEKWRKKKQYTY